MAVFPWVPDGDALWLGWGVKADDPCLVVGLHVKLLNPYVPYVSSLKARLLLLSPIQIYDYVKPLSGVG